MVAAFGSGAMFSLVSGMGGPNQAANVVTSGLFFALVQGGLFKVIERKLVHFIIASLCNIYLLTFLPNFYHFHKNDCLHMQLMQQLKMHTTICKNNGCDINIQLMILKPVYSL